MIALEHLAGNSPSNQLFTENIGSSGKASDPTSQSKRCSIATGMLKLTVMTEEQYEDAVHPSHGATIQSLSNPGSASNVTGKRQVSEREGQKRRRKMQVIITNPKPRVAVTVRRNKDNAEAESSIDISRKGKGKDIPDRPKGLDGSKVRHVRNSKTEMGLSRYAELDSEL